MGAFTPYAILFTDEDNVPLSMIVVQSIPLYEYSNDMFVFGGVLVSAPATHNPRPRSSLPYVMHLIEPFNRFVVNGIFVQFNPSNEYANNDVHNGEVEGKNRYDG